MCGRAGACVCVNSRQQLRSNGASVKSASDKRKKPDNHSRKEGKYSTSITDISITLSDC